MKVNDYPALNDERAADIAAQFKSKSTLYKLVFQQQGGAAD